MTAPMPAPHEPAHVVTGNGWEAAMYELAYLFWCAYGHNGARVEYLLERHVLAATPEGEPAAPVPSVSTINGWARDDRWEQRQWRELADDLQPRILRLQIAKLTLAESAIEQLHDVRAGKYDHDPKLAAMKSRDGHDTLRMVGMGTFGANQGGLSVPQAQELMVALGELGGESEPLSPRQRSRMAREQIAASKQGQE